MKSILDPTFCYTPSLSTDIAKTFARIRREQRNALRTVAEPTNEAVEIVSSRRAAWRGSRVEQRRDHAATRDGSVRLALLARDASRS
jgi:hypothetical protein